MNIPLAINHAINQSDGSKSCVPQNPFLNAYMGHPIDQTQRHQNEIYMPKQATLEY